MQKLSRWIGVDLDGTLSHYTVWRGPEYIGDPIPAMLERVKEWISAGVTVKIFTARASELIRRKRQVTRKAQAPCRATINS